MKDIFIYMTDGKIYTVWNIEETAANELLRRIEDNSWIKIGGSVLIRTFAICRVEVEDVRYGYESPDGKSHLVDISQELKETADGSNDSTD